MLISALLGASGVSASQLRSSNVQIVDLSTEVHAPLCDCTAIFAEYAADDVACMTKKNGRSRPASYRENVMGNYPHCMVDRRSNRVATGSFNAFEQSTEGYCWKYNQCVIHTDHLPSTATNYCLSQGGLLHIHESWTKLSTKV